MKPLEIVTTAVLLLAGFSASAMATVFPDPANYNSPYEISYTINKSDLTWDFAAREAENPTDHAVDDWYDKTSSIYDAPTPEKRTENRAWGPQAKVYDAMPGYQNKSLSWLQQRVIASAQAWIGTPYQHRHIPQFDPYSTGGQFTPNTAFSPFEIKNRPYGTISSSEWAWNYIDNWNANQKYHPGIDCSDFVSYAYNFALGTKLITNVQNQCYVDWVTMPGDGSQELIIHKFDALNPGANTPADYHSFINSLQAGDLIYVEDGITKEVSHVIMWLGEYGTYKSSAASTNDALNDIPLIINSHDNSPNIVDSFGNDVPTGVQILPYRSAGWFYTNAVEVHRILPAVAAIPEPTTLVLLGGAGVAMLLRRSRARD